MLFNTIITMDEQSTHADDELQDELEDMDGDDEDMTPADTDEESDEPKKEDAKEVEDKQTEAWLRNIRSGKKTIEDMPENLGWLRKKVESKLNPDKGNSEDLESKIRSTMQAERDAEDFNLLVDDLEDTKVDSEKLEELKEVYEDLLANGVPKLKALIYARKATGLKDSATIIHERRRKGMLLPPMGSKRRTVVKKDGLTDMEKKFTGNLPPGFKS